MYNNRAYYNDWEHQIHMSPSIAARRSRMPMSARTCTGPEPDFAKIAQGMGWYAEGPIEQPGDIAAALRRAIAQVKAGKPALIDTIVRHR